MKRSKSINLAKMRKHTRLTTPIKPLALAIATSTLLGCSSREPAQIFQTVDECLQSGTATEQECQTAYNHALAEAQKSGPKYERASDCEAEFGNRQCVTYQNSNGQNWFMPMMAGFMLGNHFSRPEDRYYYSAPLYTSYSRRSPFFGQWSTVDGHTYGSMYQRKASVSPKAFDPKPVVTRTISRGGFGSKVAAKSNWGSSGGWGKSSGRSWGG